MVFSNTRQDAVHYLSKKLTDLVISHSFPIQPGLALTIFKDSFQDNVNLNAEVEMDGGTQTMNITCAWHGPYDGKTFNMSTTFRYDEIFRGRGVFRYGSVGALYGTSKNFFDDAKAALPEQALNTPFWERLMSEMHNEVAANINNNFGRELHSLREKALVELHKNAPSQTNGKLMENLLAQYDLNQYEHSLEIFASVPRVGQAVRPELLFAPWHKFTNRNMPSPASFEAFFWGAYLFELHKAKGYPLNVETDDPYGLIMDQREDAFQKLHPKP